MTATENAAPALRRVQAHFPEAAFRTLEEIARARGKSMADVLREAVTLERWVEDARQRGGRLYFECDGHVRELLIR